MTKQTVGFIGFGNMAQAMAKGFLHSGALSGGEIFACAKRWEKLESTAGQLGIVPCRDSLEVADQADILILAVKPYLIEEVLRPLAGRLAGKVLLSVAAGWLFERFEEILPAGIHHLSTMPNTPVSIGQGIVLLEDRHSLTPEEFSQARDLLGSLGVVRRYPPAKWALQEPSPAAARPTPPCFWRRWETRECFTACPGTSPTGWRPRCWPAPASSIWRRETTPAP